MEASDTRGPEELLSPLTNGANFSPQPNAMTVDHDAKKNPLAVMANGGADPAAMAAAAAAASITLQPSSVLRVIIENMLYPVSLDILHQIFSRFGKVLRIITFSKNNTFQALVQLSEPQAAQLAKSALDGQNVYNGCCTLKIEYTTAAGLFGAAASPTMATTAAFPQVSLPNPLAAATAAGYPFTAVSNYSNYAAALPQAAALQAVNGLPPSMFPALTVATGGITSPTLANMAGIRTLPAQIAALALSPVILVSNLNEEKVTPDALFTLFGVYGDVQRVKVLFNKKDNALIQYAEPAQAQLSIQHLDKQKLWGKQIRVASSKHMNVQMPKEGQPDAGLTKDYSQSSLHRFKKPGSKNYMNIYPPSSTLHLSNIPPNITDEFLIESFTKAGCTVKAFKFFPKDHKMALMQLGSVDEAIQALILMHNFKLAENAHLRVSFSKSGI